MNRHINYQLTSISAVYLALILTLGVISVCLTILVLNLHFRPEDDKIPHWLETLTTSCLMRIAGMKSCGKCSKGSKVNGESTLDKNATKKINVLECGKEWKTN